MTKNIQRKVKHSSKRVQNNNQKTFIMESLSMPKSVKLIENNEATSNASTCAKPTKSKS